MTEEKVEKVEKPKEDGPPPDPSTAKISANKESIIEINAANKGLGLFVAGGKMVTPPVVSVVWFIRIFRFSMHETILTTCV